MKSNTSPTPTHMLPLSDLQRLMEGEHEAVWRIWQYHEADLSRRCRIWMNGNEADAEEALSRAMWRAWQKLPQHSAAINHPKAWLYQLTRNVCLDMHRERQNEAARFVALEDLVSNEDEALATQQEAPDAAVLQREKLLLLLQAISELPQQLRDPFILSVYEDMNCADIARHLMLSADTVYKRLQQARKTLQTQLQTSVAKVSTSKLDCLTPPPAVAELAAETLYELTRRCPLNPARTGGHGYEC